MLQTIPWYQSAILRQQMVQLISAAMMIFGVASDSIDVDQTVGLILGGITGATAVLTVVTRLLKKTPPITQDAAIKMQAHIDKQGGFARPFLLLALAAFCVATLAVGVQGCAGSGTRAAYAQAENPAELAYVLAENYAAVLEQAAAIKAKPGISPLLVLAIQRADTQAQPAVRALRPLRDAYLATKSAKSEAELQAAINRAVLAVAELVRSIQTAKGAP